MSGLGYRHKNEDGLTTRELCRATGLSDRLVHEKLRELMEQGLLASGKRYTAAIDGSKRQTTVYRLKS